MECVTLVMNGSNNRERTRHMRPVTPIIDRLMSKVITSPDGCWEWQGARRGSMGYSTLGNEPGKLPRNIYGHIVSYEFHKGLIPSGMVVQHSCDNPVCVNPDHLSLGTYQSNKDDCVEKMRHNKGVKQHKARLNDEIVRSIRKDAGNGEEGKSIAARLGVSDQTVYDVINGKTWKHVI